VAVDIPISIVARTTATRATNRRYTTAVGPIWVAATPTRIRRGIRKAGNI
jgi:hypothetical protein